MLDGKINSEQLLIELNKNGYVRVPAVLSNKECSQTAKLYDDPATQFRSTINMARYNFGRGEYKYFSYPLPELIQNLRTGFYEVLAPIANQWAADLGLPTDWPATLSELTARCHASGQQRPTPLLLKYSTGDYNCLHQDLYGPIHFPLQVIILLNQPDVDFDGGELMLVEQRPRMQSRGMIIPLHKGDAAIIPVRERPRLGSRGFHRVNMRHGVGEVRRGNRNTLGLIFHDAE